MTEKQGTPHRPEPFTTVQGYQDHGFTAEIDVDGWVNVGPTQRSTLAALEYLKAQGCKKVGLMLNVIPEREAYEYIPVMCTAEPAGPRSLDREPGLRDAEPQAPPFLQVL